MHIFTPSYGFGATHTGILYSRRVVEQCRGPEAASPPRPGKVWHGSSIATCRPCDERVAAMGKRPVCTGPSVGAGRQEAPQSSENVDKDAGVPLGAATAALTAWYGSCLACVKAVEVLLVLLDIPAGRACALTLFLGSLFQLGLAAAIPRLALQSYLTHGMGLFPLSWRPWREWAKPLQDGVCALLLAVQIGGLLPLLGARQVDAQARLVKQIASTDWVARCLLLAAAVVVGPVAEEIMFRGLLLPSLARHLPPWGAAATSAAVFSLAHGALDVPRLLSGLVYASLYVRTQNLWPPIFMHSLWNALGICGACLPSLLGGFLN